MKRAVTLKENHEFRRLYQRGASAVGGGMVVYCRKNKLGHNRLGLTASTKLGHAVVRNRCRRRLREVYRLNTPLLRQGYDIILVARTRTATAKWKELNDTFLLNSYLIDLTTTSLLLAQAKSFHLDSGKVSIPPHSCSCSHLVNDRIS